MKYTPTVMERQDPRPVVAICGFKDSGKTTLIELLVPVLQSDGLGVAVIKHDTHGVEVDREGKDSDRIFRSGADVLVRGPNESIQRQHPESNPELEQQLTALLESHDVVLVEGHKGTPLPKIWLRGRGNEAPPDGVEGIEVDLAWEAARASAAKRYLRARLNAAWSSRPIRGVVLVGGKSRRMGSPKQVLLHNGLALSTIAVQSLGPHVEQVVLAGSGRIPEDLRGLPRLPDPPDVSGPLAGVLAAMRWSPGSAWVVAACDMPRISSDAVGWLSDQRRPGTWAVLPCSREGYVETLLAMYEPQARLLLEAQAAAGRWGLRHLAEHPRVGCPTIPGELAEAWTNVNTPDELRSDG